MSSESEDNDDEEDDDEDDVEAEERFVEMCDPSLFLFTMSSFSKVVPMGSSPVTTVCELDDSCGICTILEGGVGCNAALILAMRLCITSSGGFAESGTNEELVDNCDVTPSSSLSP